MHKFTAIIVDDDKIELSILKMALSKYCPSVEVIGNASSVSECLNLLTKKKPDLLILDVCLGNEKSFKILDNLKKFHCEIIFTTSSEEYAIEAIKYNPTRYLIKPLNVNELREAINAVKVNLSLNNLNRKISKFKSHYLEQSPKRHSKFLAISSLKTIEIIPTSQIIYAESDSRYTIFHLTNGSKKIACKNLGEYEKLLDPNDFFRIHHRFIINVNMIKIINKEGGNYCEFLNSDVTLPIAKRRQEKFLTFLNLK